MEKEITPDEFEKIEEEEETPSAEQEGNQKPDSEENTETNQKEGDEEPKEEKPLLDPSLLAQKRHWRDKAKKFEEENTALKSQPIQPAEVEVDKKELDAKKYLSNLLDERLEARDKVQRQKSDLEMSKTQEAIGYYESIDKKFTTEIGEGIIKKYNLGYSTDENGKELHPVDIAYKMFRDGIGTGKKPVKTMPTQPKSLRSSAPSAGNDIDVSKMSWGQLRNSIQTDN